MRSDSGYLTYIITTRRMTSGELLKYRNGLLIAKPTTVKGMASIWSDKAHTGHDRRLIVLELRVVGEALLVFQQNGAAWGAIQIIAASYGQDLADKLARDTWYRALFPTRLSARKAVNDFTTTAGGEPEWRPRSAGC